MPRISAEARGAAAWRAGGEPPPPPRHLSADARRLWREIVGTRPADYFRPGATHLLETFCEAAVVERAVLKALNEMPVEDKRHGQLTRRLCALTNVTTMLATKLRLTPTATMSRWSTLPEEQAVGSSDPLLGGSAVGPRKPKKPSVN